MSGLLVSEAAHHRVMTGPCLPASQPARFFTVKPCRNQPTVASPCQGEVLVHKYLLIGALGSIHAHIFPQAEYSILTSLEEVTHFEDWEMNRKT